MSGFFFNGQHYETPTTVSAVNDAAMRDQNLPIGNILAIVGKSEGGIPATAMRFSSPQEARAVLRSGESLTAIEAAFDCSKQTGGPSTIVFVRVNPATQSALTLKGAGPVNVITLASTDYGQYTNQIKVKVESGSSNGKKISTQFGNSIYSKDNIYRRAFSIHYTGSASTATLTLTATAATVAIDGSASVVLDLADYPTIGALVDRINVIAPGDLSASVLDGSIEKPSLQGLDGVTTQDIKTAAYTATATLQACVDWLNSIGEGFVTATRVTNAVKVPSNIDWTYLSGGSDGDSTADANNDNKPDAWQAALDALQLVDVQWVVPVSSNQVIHDMVSAHCTYMSNIMRMERRCIVGPDLSTDIATATASAVDFDDDRLYMVCQGVYLKGSAPGLDPQPPYITAAIIGGMAAGSGPGTSLTNKSVNIRGLEYDVRNPTDTDVLCRAGVVAIEKTRDGVYKVVQSVSTWQVNDNYNRREMATGTATDYVARTVREAVDVLRGERQSPLLLAQAVSIIETALIQCATPMPAGPGVIVGDATNPAYKNIRATITGDVLNIEFQCSPVIPCNYIPITINAVPYTGTLAAAA